VVSGSQGSLLKQLCVRLFACDCENDRNWRVYQKCEMLSYVQCVICKWSNAAMQREIL
jgi:hypothetical protein